LVIGSVAQYGAGSQVNARAESDRQTRTAASEFNERDQFLCGVARLLLPSGHRRLEALHRAFAHSKLFVELAQDVLWRQVFELQCLAVGRDHGIDEAAYCLPIRELLFSPFQQRTIHSIP
jgi:hypothetical protein